MMRIQIILFSILCIIFVHATDVEVSELNKIPFRPNDTELNKIPFRPNDTDVSRYASYSYSQTYDDLVPGNMSTEVVLYTSIIIIIYVTLTLVSLWKRKQYLKLLS